MTYISIALSESFPFLFVKFSIYLNRRVFVLSRLIIRIYIEVTRSQIELQVA